MAPKLLKALIYLSLVTTSLPCSPCEDAVEIAVDEEPERVGDRCRLQCRRPSYSPCTQGATCREVHWNISGVLVINSEFYRLAFSDLICVASLNVVTRPEHDDAVFQCRIDFVKADNSNLTCYSEPVSFQLKDVATTEATTVAESTAATTDATTESSPSVVSSTPHGGAHTDDGATDKTDEKNSTMEDLRMGEKRFPTYGTVVAVVLSCAGVVVLILMFFVWCKIVKRRYRQGSNDILLNGSYQLNDVSYLNGNDSYSDRSSPRAKVHLVVNLDERDSQDEIFSQAKINPQVNNVARGETLLQAVGTLRDKDSVQEEESIQKETSCQTEKVVGIEDSIQVESNLRKEDSCPAEDIVESQDQNDLQDKNLRQAESALEDPCNEITGTSENLHRADDTCQAEDIVESGDEINLQDENLRQAETSENLHRADDTCRDKNACHEEVCVQMESGQEASRTVFHVPTSRKEDDQRYEYLLPSPKRPGDMDGPTAEVALPAALVQSGPVKGEVTCSSKVARRVHQPKTFASRSYEVSSPEEPAAPGTAASNGADSAVLKEETVEAAALGPALPIHEALTSTAVTQKIDMQGGLPGFGSTTEK